MVLVDDEDAFETGRQLAAQEGILAGISSGAAMWAAQQVAARPDFKGKRIVGHPGQPGRTLPVHALVRRPGHVTGHERLHTAPEFHPSWTSRPAEQPVINQAERIPALIHLQPSRSGSGGKGAVGSVWYQKATEAMSSCSGR